jgi:hypothetical protein
MIVPPPVLWHYGSVRPEWVTSSASERARMTQGPFVDGAAPYVNGPVTAERQELL